LLQGMSLDAVTLDDAVRLLTLPRVLGDIDGEEVTAQNGRYGPYLRKGSDSRSLENEEQMFTVTLDDARAIFSQPKPQGRRTAAPPLRKLGNDPVSGAVMLVKDGRFGPYVTDGEVNASLRKDDDVATLTDERAAELLAEKRSKGPSPRKRVKKAAKKAAKKPAKKAAKKAAAKTAKKAASNGAGKVAATTAAAPPTASPSLG
jgi:DNA topoisomerase I